MDGRPPARYSGSTMELLINIDVPDLEAAIRFYTAALPLQLARRLGTDFAELAGATTRLFVIQQAEGTPTSHGAAGTRTYRRHWTPVHVDYVVTDLPAAMRRAEAAGARPEGTVHDAPYGQFMTYGDPFGHGFCLLSFRGRGYDEIATG